MQRNVNKERAKLQKCLIRNQAILVDVVKEARDPDLTQHDLAELPCKQDSLVREHIRDFSFSFNTFQVLLHTIQDKVTAIENEFNSLEG